MPSRRRVFVVVWCVLDPGSLTPLVFSNENNKQQKVSHQDNYHVRVRGSLAVENLAPAVQKVDNAIHPLISV